MLSSNARRLIESHLHLVGRQARYLRHRYRLDVPMEELESFGRMGLVDAAERFDPERGHAFASFARPRIRGAILDGLAQLGPSGRTRRRGGHLKRVRRRHDQLPGEQASAELELSRRRLRSALHQALAELPDRARLLVERRYFEHRTLVDIGLELGVSKSRASRLHAAALRKLRAALAEVMSVGEDTLDAELAQVA
jgi:RNA polymerase sigma factor for flagellar operon FliA